MVTYSEKLKDPRWQKKRLQILERDKFQCQDCGHKGKTLHVHHKYYIFKKDPWEYPDDLLITLCEDCHRCWEGHSYIVNDFTKVLLSDGWTPYQLLFLLNEIRQSKISGDDMNVAIISSRNESFDNDLDDFARNYRDE